MHKMAFAHVFGPEKKFGFGPFSYKFFVCTRVGLSVQYTTNINVIANQNRMHKMAFAHVFGPEKKKRIWSIFV